MTNPEFKTMRETLSLVKPRPEQSDKKVKTIFTKYDWWEVNSYHHDTHVHVRLKKQAFELDLVNSS